MASITNSLCLSASCKYALAGGLTSTSSCIFIFNRTSYRHDGPQPEGWGLFRFVLSWVSQVPLWNLVHWLHGRGPTFARKSPKCLWHDWYISLCFCRGLFLLIIACLMSVKMKWHSLNSLKSSLGFQTAGLS